MKCKHEKVPSEKNNGIYLRLRYIAYKDRSTLLKEQATYFTTMTASLGKTVSSK